MLTENVLILISRSTRRGTAHESALVRRRYVTQRCREQRPSTLPHETFSSWAAMYMFGASLRSAPTANFTGATESERQLVHKNSCKNKRTKLPQAGTALLLAQREKTKQRLISPATCVGRPVAFLSNPRSQRRHLGKIPKPQAGVPNTKAEIYWRGGWRLAHLHSTMWPQAVATLNACSQRNVVFT